MGETELRQIREEIMAMLATVDRCYWSPETRSRYSELISRETALLKQRELAVA
jgi:hypothetical protein